MSSCQRPEPNILLLMWNVQPNFSFNTLNNHSLLSMFQSPTSILGNFLFVLPFSTLYTSIRVAIEPERSNWFIYLSSSLDHMLSEGGGNVLLIRKVWNIT